MDLHINLLVLLKFLIASILIKSSSASCTYEKRYDETYVAEQQNIRVTKTHTVCCDGYVQIQAEFNEIICYPECKNCLQGYCVTPISKLSNNEKFTTDPLTSDAIDSSNSTVRTDYISLYTSMIVSPLFFIIRMILIIVTLVLIINIKKIQNFQIHSDLSIENVLPFIINQPIIPEPKIKRDLPAIPPDDDGLYDEIELLKSARPQSDGYMPMGNKPRPHHSTYTEIV